MGGTSANKIDVFDTTAFIAPIRRLDTSPGNPNYDIRWDLNPGKGVFNEDINISDFTMLNNAGSSGYPPMFLGLAAYNGPSCTP